MYEMCVQVPLNEDSVEKTLETAKKLGWKGICLLAERKEMKALRDNIKKSKTQTKGTNVSLGLLLIPKNKNDMKRQVANNRKNYEIITVRPGSPETSRAAAETRGVDILIGWESCGQTSHERVMDYITVKLAAEKGVAIAFSLQPLLAAYDRARATIMSKYLETARFVRKYKAPFLLTSGALSPMDLRAPSELTAFGKVLGFNGREIKHALSGAIITKNRKKLGKKWVMPGVEVG
jgi:ribonuclease P/MRP protein subunit RPP1